MKPVLQSNSRTANEPADAVFPAPMVVRRETSPEGRPETAIRKIDPRAIALRGIRSLESDHLSLRTDLPSSPEVDAFPAIFDQAASQFVEWFGVDPQRVVTWKPVGCIMRDRATFEASGLCPRSVPKLSGYSIYDAFWCERQESVWYQRHLMIHEGVHCFMVAQFGGCGAPWYMEGCAELLGTHRLDADGRLTIGVIPAFDPRPTILTTETLAAVGARPISGVVDKPGIPRAGGVAETSVVNSGDANGDAADPAPGWGRIRTLQRLVREGKRRSLTDVMRISSAIFDPHEAYCWCWAAAQLLVSDPDSCDVFRAMACEVLRSDFTPEMLRRFGDTKLRRLEAEWFAFLTDLEFGMEYARSRVGFGDTASARPLPAGSWTKCEVSADRGWTPTGLFVRSGDLIRIAARGTFSLADEPVDVDGEPVPIESGPDGISIHYYRGEPIGRLMLAIATVNDPTGLAAPVAVVHNAEMSSPRDGEIFLRINSSAADLARHAGSCEVALRAKN